MIASIPTRYATRRIDTNAATPVWPRRCNMRSR
jgi:hypothetical protein